eukprot:15337-Heterococcus_DN1.PRE.3
MYTAATCHNCMQSVNEATTATAAAVAAGTAAAAATASANASSSSNSSSGSSDTCVPESVKLLAHWCANSETDNDVRGRFKLIGDVKNADTVGLPSFCRKFNGKPILIHGKESSFCRDVALGRAELDVNAHAFSFIGRKGLYGTLGKWQHALLNVGVLIEGRCDAELPEQVLGAATFHGLDISRTEQLAFNADSTALAVGDEEDIQLVRARKMATKGQDPTAATAAAAALRSKQRAGTGTGNNASSIASTGYGASPLSRKKQGHSGSSKSSSSSSSSLVCRWILPTAALAVLVLLGYWYTFAKLDASTAQAHSGWSGSAVSTVDRLLRPLLQLFLYKDGSGSK